MVRLEMDLTQAREQAIQRLGALREGNINKVLKKSLKRATDTYQASTIRETKKRYLLKRESIKKNMHITPSGNGFIFTTLSRSKLITHYDYSSVVKTGGEKRIGKHQYFKARVFKKSKLTYLPNTFWVKSEADKKGGMLLKRPEGLTGKAAHPKKKKNWLVLGPAVGTIVRNQETVDISEKRAKEILKKRIDHEVDRILNSMT